MLSEAARARREQRVRAGRPPPPIENVFERVDPGARKPLLITGMFGVGDNLHQRAALRILVEHYDVYLETCHAWLYHDLIAKGLKLLPRPTRLWMHAANLEREQSQFTYQRPPNDAPHWKIWYLKHAIDKYGSILEAMNASFFMPGLKSPDFSLPIRQEWRARALDLIATWYMNGKPLLIHRPVVLRKEWDSANRNPDISAYDELYRSIRDRFFVVSIASLAANIEWIVGPKQDVDVRLYRGELDFETMAALFAEANLVFANAGFAPVMAQAVGTPSITVYGGRESFRTTQRAGAHLAPSLGIDPDRPCDCHSRGCDKCNKRITMGPALARVTEFAERFECQSPRCGRLFSGQPTSIQRSVSSYSATG
jgi:hypothetical protein